MVKVLEMDIERLKKRLSIMESQHQLAVQEIQKVFSAKEERQISKISELSHELKSKELEFKTKLDLAQNQIKMSSALTNNSNSEAMKLVNDLARISLQFNQQLEALKKDRVEYASSLVLSNKLKEKEAQVTYLMNEVKAFKEQKEQLESSTTSDKALIRM